MHRVLMSAAAVLAAVGCDTRSEPEFTCSPAVTYPDRGSDAQVGAPDRPSISVRPTAIELGPVPSSETIRVRSGGARQLVIESMSLTEGAAFRVEIGETDVIGQPDVLLDPDQDGALGVALSGGFTLTVTRLEMGLDSAELVIASNDPQRPRVTVALNTTDVVPEDAAVPDAADATTDDAALEDAGVDAAGPEGCRVSADCAVAVQLDACDPCPVGSTVAALEAMPCRVPYEPQGLLFDYPPVACTAACPADVAQSCPLAPPTAECEAGVCVIRR